MLFVERLWNGWINASTLWNNIKHTHLLESNCTEKKQSYHVLNNKWQKVMKQKILLRWFWSSDSKAALQDDMKLPIFIHSGKVHLFVKLKRTPLEK